MSDRELLELAAKAAFMDIEWQSAGWAHNYENGCKWNPLEDDGDALRLAVKAGITPIHDKKEKVCAAYWTDVNCCNATYKDDPYAASRRAIVRAAAEIGKKMK